jgi:hypothetical protein
MPGPDRTGDDPEVVEHRNPVDRRDELRPADRSALDLGDHRLGRLEEVLRDVQAVGPFAHELVRVAPERLRGDRDRAQLVAVGRPGGADAHIRRHG